jgi:hypothetical protein
MIPIVHTLVLLGCVAWTIRAIRQQGRRPTEKQVLLGLAAGLAVGVLALFVAVHMCMNGTPVSQWLIPSACLSATLLFVRPSFTRRLASAALVVAAFALSFQYSAEVHHDRYIGVSGLGSFEWHSPVTGLYRCRTSPCVAPPFRP